LWTLPASLTPDTDYHIRIASIIDENIYNVSDDFEILENTIKVISPSSGNKWEMLREHVIEWTDVSNENVKIELYNGTILEQTIESSTENDGSYLWEMPAGLTPGTHYRIRIVSVLDDNIFDDSDYFEILDNTIKVISPTSGIKWEMETEYLIEWTDVNSENVKIELYKTAALEQTIESSTESDGSYLWEIPAGLTPGTDYQIKITNTNDNGIYGESGNFKIMEYPFREPITDYDGNIYRTAQIGTQVWIIENLKTTHYANGTVIPLVSDNDAWAILRDNYTDDAYCYYNNNTGGEADIYGALYTWAAAMGDSAVSSNTNPSGVQGVCPDNWHLPSDAEWTELTDYLGGERIAGDKMKATGFSSNNGATNESHFTGLVAGYRSGETGVFWGLGTSAYFWSSTNRIFSSYTGNRTLSLNWSWCQSTSIYRSVGSSVRCVKD
jgi:uncharacterized protein (TIGR02145 family)